MKNKNNSNQIVELEGLKCLAIEEILYNGTVYNAIIKNIDGTNFQGHQFSNESFEILSRNRMFTKGTKYREFYFKLNEEREKIVTGSFFWKKEEQDNTPLDLASLKKEVNDLCIFINNALLTKETINLNKCMNCGYETFEDIIIGDHRRLAELTINEQVVNLKACQKCGNLILD